MNKKTLYFLSVAEGAFVVSAELCGGKMLAPVFGSSLYIWTSVIGVTLFSLTAGYFIGGLLSAKRNPQIKLFFLFSIAATFTALMPFIADKVFLNSIELNLFLNCIIMSVLLLSVPLICLGATTPIIIQLYQADLIASGKVSGKFYALSTCGGIACTFLLGFFIIPSFGVRLPVFITGVLMLTASLFVREVKIKLRLSLFVLITIGSSLIFFFEGRKKNSNSFKDIYESEGIMGQLKVVDFWSEDGKLNRALLSNNSAQSIITKTNVTAISQYNYVHFVSAISTLKPENSSVLLLGMAGGSLCYELQKQGFKIDVVDIDERTFKIAERYFYFQKNNTALYNDDARHFIKTAKNNYDMIIIDISSSEVQPSYLYTLESFKEVKQILKPGGIFFVNFQGILTGNSKLALATWSVDHTLKAAGFKSYHYSFSNDKADDVQFISSATPINFQRLDSSRVNLCCSQNEHVINFIKNKYLDSTKSNTGLIPLLLTDDKPQLEQLKFETVMESRNTIRKEIRKKESLMK